MNLIIRPLTQTDEPVLWEMLYLAIHVPAGETSPPPEVVRQPELARYVQDWGREGDLGYAAVDAKSGELMGAAWLRLWSGRDQGYGYIDDETPELSIALRPASRGRGVGTVLVEHLLETAVAHFTAVSLSVDPENPAVHLYRRLGFEEMGMAGASLVMKKDLQGAAG